MCKSMCQAGPLDCNPALGGMTKVCGGCRCWAGARETSHLSGCQDEEPVQ